MKFCDVRDRMLEQPQISWEQNTIASDTREPKDTFRFGLDYGNNDSFNNLKGVIETFLEFFPALGSLLVRSTVLISLDKSSAKLATRS